MGTRIASVRKGRSGSAGTRPASVPILVGANFGTPLRRHGVPFLFQLVRELSPSAHDVPPAILALSSCIVGEET